MRIEQLSERHLDAVTKLEATCFSDPWSRNQLQEECENSLAKVLVAVDDDGRVMGYAGLHYVIDEAGITNVSVFPEDRRHGVAKALMQELDRFCRTSNMAFLTLEVRASNAGAIALYEKLGFQNVGTRKNFYTHPTEDALLMTKYYESVC